MRIFTPCLIFQCVFTHFQCVITLLRALSVALGEIKDTMSRFENEGEGVVVQ